jgi:hypothetical protein
MSDVGRDWYHDERRDPRRSEAVEARARRERVRGTVCVGGNGRLPLVRRAAVRAAAVGRAAVRGATVRGAAVRRGRGAGSRRVRRRDGRAGRRGVAAVGRGRRVAAV